ASVTPPQPPPSSTPESSASLSRIQSATIMPPVWKSAASRVGPPPVSQPSPSYNDLARSRSETPSVISETRCSIAREGYVVSHGPRSARRVARLGAAVPPAPDLGVDRRRGGVLRRDDERACGAPRPAGRARPVLVARAPARGAVARRHCQGALLHDGRPSRGGGPDAVPGRPPLGVRLVAVGLS